MFQKNPVEAFFYQYNDLLMSLFSTTSVLSCKIWFVNCLTITFALVLSDRIDGVKKMVWHWGHFSLIKAKDLALFFATWRIKRQEFISSIGTRLWCMSSIVAPGKMRILTTPFFHSSRIPFIMEPPAITVVSS